MKKTGLLYIIIASVLWGTSGIFVHHLAPYGITSMQMTLIRSLVSFICIAGYILISDRTLFRTNLKELLLFAGSGLSFFSTATCYYHSMQLTSISTAVVLMYTAPIFVMIYSVMFLGEKLTKTKLIAVIAKLIGCALVSGIIGGLKFNALGILIGFMSGISYASYNILTKIAMQKGINPIKANLYCFIIGTIIGLAVSNPPGLITSMSAAPIVTSLLGIGVGIVACVLPYFFYTLALREIPAGTASSLGILEPMAATILSIIIFGEVLYVSSAIGIVLILAAVFMLGKESE